MGRAIEVRNRPSGIDAHESDTGRNRFIDDSRDGFATKHGAALQAADLVHTFTQGVALGFYEIALSVRKRFHAEGVTHSSPGRSPGTRTNGATA